MDKADGQKTMVTETKPRPNTPTRPRASVAPTPHPAPGLSPPRAISLERLITSFHLSRQRLAPRTVYYYETNLKNFLWYARKKGWPEDAGLITRDHIRQFLEYVAQDKNRWGYTDPTRSSSHQASPATVNHYGRVVKRLFRWASDEEELIPDNGIWRLKLPKPHYRQVEPYTDEEVLAMLLSCDDEYLESKFLGSRNKAIISMFADTGMRLSELGGIKLQDLASSLKQVRVMGKGSKQRVLPLQGESQRALSRYLNQRPKVGSDYVWLSEEGGRLSSSSITSMVERLKKRAGVTSGGMVHRFRHYFATKYLEAGGNLSFLRVLMGHETYAMVLHYSKLVDAGKAISEHDQFSPLDRLMRGKKQKNDDGWGWQE